jgi:hypothetical protein
MEKSEQQQFVLSASLIGLIISASLKVAGWIFEIVMSFVNKNKKQLKAAFALA